MSFIVKAIKHVFVSASSDATGQGPERSESPGRRTGDSEETLAQPLSSRGVDLSKVVARQESAILTGKLLVGAACLMNCLEGDLSAVLKYSPLLYCAVRVMPEAWVQKIGEMEGAAVPKAFGLLVQLASLVKYAALNPRETVTNSIAKLCELVGALKVLLKQLLLWTIESTVKLGLAEWNLVLKLATSWKFLTAMLPVASAWIANYLKPDLGIASLLSDGLTYCMESSAGSYLELLYDIMPFKVIAGTAFMLFLMGGAAKYQEVISTDMTKSTMLKPSPQISQ